MRLGLFCSGESAFGLPSPAFPGICLFPSLFSHACDALEGDCTAQALHILFRLYRVYRIPPLERMHAPISACERDHSPAEEDSLDSL
eukprot:4371553-Prymnesium_polylepis.1